MGKQEEIYTVHVKCRPDPGQNYPSERAYSSSTVGGLALTHLTLATVGTTLYAVTYVNSGFYTISDLLGGFLLTTGCLFSFITGVLASKRWYVDRYIRWYFVANLLSSVTATLSAILTIYSLIKPDGDSSWFVVESFRTTDENTYDARYQRELYLHISLTSIVETIVSLLSLKISWKGIRNRSKTALPTRTDGDGGFEPSETNRPDILENHSQLNSSSNYSNVVKELYKLQKSSIIARDDIGNKIVSKMYSMDPSGLPRPESQKEYRERIELFLNSHDNFDNNTPIS